MNTMIYEILREWKFEMKLRSATLILFISMKGFVKGATDLARKCGKYS